jgi:hypothetical protein
MDKSGTIFVNRLGTSSVMRVDKSLLSAIAIHPYEWLHSRLWSLSRVDLVGIDRSTPQLPQLTLEYADLNEAWKGTAAGVDVTDKINPDNANYLLGALESLKISRWLAADDTAAATALAKPTLTLVIKERIVTDLGDDIGIEQRELKFAPLPGASPPQFYYGRLTSDAHPFWLDRASYEKLAVELLGGR